MPFGLNRAGKFLQKHNIVSGDDEPFQPPKLHQPATVVGNFTKTLRMRQIKLIIFFILLFGCNRIENKKWKYQDGFSIGDWIEFNEVGLFIRNDTIFNKEKPIAKIYDHKERIIDQILIIEELNDTTKGYYCSKGEK